MIDDGHAVTRLLVWGHHMNGHCCFAGCWPCPQCGHCRNDSLGHVVEHDRWEQLQPYLNTMRQVLSKQSAELRMLLPYEERLDIPDNIVLGEN